jgi:hypothetical protein
MILLRAAVRNDLWTLTLGNSCLALLVLRNKLEPRGKRRKELGEAQGPPGQASGWERAIPLGFSHAGSIPYILFVPFHLMLAQQRT